MGGNKLAANSLLLQKQFRLLNVHQSRSLRIVIFLDLIFWAGINENPCSHSFAGLPTIFDSEISFIASTVFSLHDIHNAAFCKVMNGIVKEYAIPVKKAAFEFGTLFLFWTDVESGGK